MLVIAWTDWTMRKIPDEYMLGVFLTGIISMYLLPEITMIQRIGGCFLLSIPLLVLTCVISGSIGGGDIKLMAAGGFLLGSEAIWKAFMAGMISAGVYVLILLAAKKAHRKTEIALGSFLSIGMILALIKI